MRKKLNCFGDAFCCGGGDIDSVATVVVDGWAEVPSVNAEAPRCLEQRELRGQGFWFQAVLTVFG